MRVECELDTAYYGPIPDCEDGKHFCQAWWDARGRAIQGPEDGSLEVWMVGKNAITVEQYELSPWFPEGTPVIRLYVGACMTWRIGKPPIMTGRLTNKIY